MCKAIHKEMGQGKRSTSCSPAWNPLSAGCTFSVLVVVDAFVALF